MRRLPKNNKIFDRQQVRDLTVTRWIRNFLFPTKHWLSRLLPLKVAINLALLFMIFVWDATAKTGLPLPRFVSLRSDHVNVRVGPGLRYPLEWVFQRTRMPVEVVAEFDTWRKIRDFEGTEGWVHQGLLSGGRTVMIKESVRVLRKRPQVEAAALAYVEPGVIAKLVRCEKKWCCIHLNEGIKGWVQREEIWGVYPNERIE